MSVHVSTPLRRLVTLAAALVAFALPVRAAEVTGVGATIAPLGNPLIACDEGESGVTTITVQVSVTFGQFEFGSENFTVNLRRRQVGDDSLMNLCTVTAARARGERRFKTVQATFQLRCDLCPDDRDGDTRRCTLWSSCGGDGWASTGGSFRVLYAEVDGEISRSFGIQCQKCD